MISVYRFSAAASLPVSLSCFACALSSLMELPGLMAVLSARDCVSTCFIYEISLVVDGKYLIYIIILLTLCQYTEINTIG